MRFMEITWRLHGDQYTSGQIHVSRRTIRPSRRCYLGATSVLSRCYLGAISVLAQCWLAAIYVSAISFDQANRPVWAYFGWGLWQAAGRVPAVRRGSRGTRT